MLGVTSWLALAGSLTAETPTQEIYGGAEVASCGWPTTVSLEGECTGTLVHPQVVIYAEHCGSGYDRVFFGESDGGSRIVPTEFCSTYNDGYPGGLGNGTDFALCVLAEPQDDIEIVPILMGCETSILSAGRPVVGVGFGHADIGPDNTKREVSMNLDFIENNEAFAGGGGEGVCFGDSGGPLYVQMAAVEGGDDTWRVFGIASYTTEEVGGCGGGGYYSMMHIGMEWFESESGFDLTPCHDADGTWNPTPECGDFPLNPGNAGGLWADGCDPGEVGPSLLCAGPFEPSTDADPPSVSISTPATGTRFDSDPGTGQAALPVTAIAADVGYGIDTVRLTINGTDVPGAELSAEPYKWNGVFPAGQYTFQVIATDAAGNVAESELVYVGVDMEAREPGSDSGDSGGSGTGDVAETGVASAGDDTAGDGVASVGDGTDGEGSTSGVPLTGGQDETSIEGCGCRSTGRTPAGYMLGMLGLLGVSRRRRISR